MPTEKDLIQTASAPQTGRLVWDKEGERLYETGVSNCALYVRSEGVYEAGVPWNGLTKITESPSGGEATPIYADNVKYLNMQSAEDFGATIEAYTYPDKFEECDGNATIGDGITVSQQPRKMFAFAYKTLIGSDDKGTNKGYKLHIVYGATAAPSSKDRSTVNESPEAVTMSWEISTVPVPVDGYKPTSHIVINSLTTKPAVLKEIEDTLYGSAEKGSKLMTPAEILAVIKKNADV